MKISVITPAKNEEDYIGRTLESVKKQEGPYEIIVVSSATDKTKDIAREYGSRVVDVDSVYRSALMNEGVKHTTGDVFVFLHPDTILPDNAFAKIRHALSDQEVVGGAFHISFDHDHWFMCLVAFGSNIRLVFKKSIYGDQTLFIKKDIYEKIGGFPQLKLFEDLAFCNLLKKKGKLIFLKPAVVTSARRFLRVGMFKQSLINSYLKVLYVLGVSDTRMYRIYHLIKEKQK